MMVGAVSVCPVTEPAVFLNHAMSYDITSVIFCGKSAYLPHKSATEVPSPKKYVLLFQSRRRKLTARTIAYSKPPEQDDTLKQIFPHLTDDQESVCPDDEGHSEEPTEETIASMDQHGTDLQPTLLEQGNQAVNLHILALEQWNSTRLKMCHRNYSVSAANLLQYLALKSLDIGDINEEFSSTGLSNLETVNRQVLSSLYSCIHMLTSSGSKSPLRVEVSNEGLPNNKSLGNQNLDIGRTTMMKSPSNRDLLLGRFPSQKSAHIMVTVGQESVEDDTLIPGLISSGATIFRINCAHGNPDLWSNIVGTIRNCSQHLEKPCRILMDLAGPKLRTGKLKDGPCVVKISPRRNAFGDVIRPALVWLCPQGAVPPPLHLSPDIILHVDGQEFLKKLEVNNSVTFHDARGKKRTFKIISKHLIFSGVGFLAECSKPAYVESGTPLYIKKKQRKSSVGSVVDVPPMKQYVRLRIDDLLTICRACSDEQDMPPGSSPDAHKITCPSGYLFDSVKPGDPIAFDDGKIWGVVKGTSSSEVVVKITHAGPNGTKLGSEKSINIPESDIRYEGLTTKDLMDIDFVAAHADMVGISFVRNVQDISFLYQEVAKRKFSRLGIVLKIETKSGFENLPLLILEAMKSPNSLGVMIARGDLAVECGWEKLADIQEEIISICSAAHVPVILATQVLESLIKTGVPSRAEIIDAANGRRVSCVMLNKGKHIVKAVSVLDTILNSQEMKPKAELQSLMLSVL